MPLKRVPSGTIPPGYEPPYIQRKKREIEQFLNQEYNSKIIEDRMNQTPETFSGKDRTFEPDTFQKDISYRTDVTNQGTGVGPRNTKIIGAVIHYTGDSRDSAINSMNNPLTKGRGYNIIIRKDGVAEQVVPPDQYTHHILPPTDPRRTTPNYPQLNNRNTLGIAFEAKGPKDVSELQKQTGNELLGQLNLPAHNIVGHGELQGGVSSAGVKGNKDAAEGSDFARAFRKAQAGTDPLGQAQASDKNLSVGNLPSGENFGNPPLSALSNPEPGGILESYLQGSQNWSQYNDMPGANEIAPGQFWKSADYQTQLPMGGSPESVASVEGQTAGSASSAGLPPGATSLGAFLGLDPSGARKGAGPGAFTSKVQVPQMPGAEQEMAAFGGPEQAFPAPPPPPPRTPPGMNPPLARRRRNSFG